MDGDNGNDNSLQIAFENITDEYASIIKADMEDVDTSRFFKLVGAIKTVLSPAELSKTRIVMTADFIKSVEARQNTEHKYSIERGSGIVAGKTMQPDKNGIVDVIFHLYLLAPQDNPDISADRDLHIVHVGIHEAVHAHLHHLNTNPFDVDRREDFPYAMRQFIFMASEQAEEHLAEYTSIGNGHRQNWTNPEAVESALRALEDVLEAKLPMTHDSIDYSKAVHTIFGAFRIMWKALVFLAAELRDGDMFREIPNEVAKLEVWQYYIAPWWNEYLELLGKIPTSLDVDIQRTDRVVKDLAEYLQTWSAELGYDFHDTSNGDGWFQIENPVY